MKILHIAPRFWPAFGGAELHMSEIAFWTARNKKNEVDVWTTDAEEVDALWFPTRKKFTKLEEEHRGVKIKRFPTTPLFMKNIFINKAIRYVLVHAPISFLRILGTPPTCFTMWMQIFRKDLPAYDVVHAFCMPYFSLLYIARAIARKTGAKFYLYSLTHIGNDRKDIVYKKYFDPVAVQFYLDADKIFVQTDAERNAIVNFVREKGKEISLDKFEKVSVGVHPDQVTGGNAERFRKNFKVGKEQVVLSIGAKVENKGTFTLVKAMEKLWKKGRTEKLVLAGNSSIKFENFWKEQSKLVKSNTINMDAPTDADKHDALSASNLLVLTSSGESYGIVYLEAWLDKKPVIGASVAAVKEVVSDGVDGYLVPFKDVDALAQKIEYLLDNPDIAKEMGKRGYEKVMSSGIWDAKFKILDKYFNERS